MATPLLSALLAASSFAWGQAQIERVDFTAPGVANASELQRIFAVGPGSVLSRSEIRSGIQALMATGFVEDVQVQANETTTGITLHVRVWCASRITALAVIGSPPKLEGGVRTALALRVGTPLRLDTFEKNLQAAQSWIRREGYPRAVIEPELVFDSGRGDVAVRIKVLLGSPSVLSRLEAPGSVLTEVELVRATELRIGQRLTASILESARRQLAKRIRRAGFWEVEVETPKLGDEASGVVVLFDVRRGPHYTLNLLGLKREKTLEAEALPFLAGDDSFNDGTLDEVRTNLRQALQRRGRLLAKVEGAVIGAGDERTLRLVVDLGLVTPIKDVRFPGLQTVTRERVLAKIGARPGHPWRWGGEGVDELTLAADSLSILGILHEAGLADAKISEPRIVPEKDGVVIEFPIVEGVLVKVSNLHIVGLPDGFVLPAMPLVLGGPWSLEGEEDYRGVLLAALQERGYLDARVSVAHACESASCSVDVAIVPGMPTVVGRVVVAGLVKANRAVVEKVAGVKKDEITGPGRQLEAQRRLLSLGIFDGVSVRPIAGQSSGNRRGFIIDLKEGPSRAVTFGVGYDTEQKARVSASWSELNFFGTARSLSVDARLSSREQRFQLTYREPPALGFLGVPTWISIFRTQEHFESYDLLRRGMWIELGDRLRRPTRALLRYDYQIVEPKAAADILSNLERDRQPRKIASITPVFEIDTRDDIFLPRQGVLVSMQWEEAFKLFLADAAYRKVTVSAATFAPLGGGVVAAAIRFGGIKAKNGRDSSRPDPINVPISTRFFAGGRISHRAFDNDRLGIPAGQQGETLNEKGDPKGGGGLGLINLEWRFPLWGRIGGCVFIDGGNVWREVRDMSLGGLRWGGGVGIRVETPVGPLRLEYGWKLDRMIINPGPPIKRESPGKLYFSFGNPF